MRRLENRPYQVIVPLHVERMLRQVERPTAAALRAELDALAERYSKSPPAFAEPVMRQITVNGTTIDYECDPVNGAIIAMDVTGNL